MAEYIEREKLMSILKEKRRKLSENSRHFFTKLIMLLKFEQLVNSVPTADVEPIKHGKWLINSDGYYPYCSECGNEPPNRTMTDYCPCCGAKMEGKI